MEWILIPIILVIIIVAMTRKAKPPADPEERLKELIGPQGMAQRDRNVAASQAKWDAELLEGVTKAINYARARGDLKETQKLEDYAQSIRNRMPGSGHTAQSKPKTPENLSPELKTYLTQLCKVYKTSGGFLSKETHTIGQEIYEKHGHKSMVEVCDELRRVLGAAAARDLEYKWVGIGEWQS